MSEKIFIGTDSGATTTKFSAVRENGEAVSTKVLQRPTNSENGREAVITAWIAGVGEFLAQNKLQWPQVAGVGLAIPGPYERYGVFGKSPNLPASFCGWDVHADYSAALAKQTGRHAAAGRGQRRQLRRRGRGAARARQHQRLRRYAHARLRPRRGVRRRGRPVARRRHARRHGSRPHARAAASARPHRQAASRAAADATGAASRLTRPFPACRICWRKNCQKYPGHELAKSAAPIKEKVLSLRSRAQKGDALALEIFDFQARVHGPARRQPRRWRSTRASSSSAAG